MRRILTLVMAFVILFSVCTMSSITLFASSDTELCLSDESSLLVIGSNIYGTNGSITAAELAGHFNKEIEIKSDGKIIGGNDYVPSESIISAKNSEVKNTYKVIISGDVNKDGRIDTLDVIQLMKKVAGWDVSVSEESASVTKKSGFATDDIIQLMCFNAGWDIILGYYKVQVNNEPQKALYEASDISIWCDHSTNKLGRSDTSSTGKHTYLINSAKNEIEGCSIYISSSKAYENITVKASDFEDSFGNKVKSEAYIFYYHKMLEGKYYPDAIIPAYADKVKINQGESQGFIVNAVVPEDAQAGLYEATFKIFFNDKEIKRVKVYLNVWDFALDDRDACDTSFGLTSYEIYKEHNASGDDDNELYKNYYDYLLKNRMNAYNLPYKLDDERSLEYLNNPRVRAFVVAGKGYGSSMDRDDKYIKDAYKLLSSNSEWMDKAYFYYTDEPYFDERYHSVEDSYKEVTALFPGARMMVPFEYDPITYTGQGLFEFMTPYVSIFCARMFHFTPEKYRSTPGTDYPLTVEQTAKYGTYKSRIDKLCAENSDKESWWYFARHPFEPYVSFHAEAPGTHPRISFWQMKQNDITGVLYYLVNDWDGNPYRSIESTTGGGPTGNLPTMGTKTYGNGILTYPGNKYGIYGPIGSIRVEHIRDGIEDYMYFTMIERLAGKDKANEFITKVTRDLVDYSDDAELLYSVRAEMGAFIEEAVSKGK